MSTHLQPPRAAVDAPDAIVTLPPTADDPGRTVTGFAAARAHIGDGLRGALVAVAHPRLWSRRWVAFAVLTLLYVVLSVLIVVPHTPVLRFDSYLVNLHLWHKHPQWYPTVSFVVGFGQRWIMTYVLQLVFIWAAFRERSIRPLVLFGTAILVLNVTVGALKYALGRIGPILQDNPHDLFHLGGSIFPSGHVSNAVVLYSVLAWALPRYRAPLIAFAIVVSVSVGLGTVFMRTHWFSDVVGGWLIGGMVLLFVPTVLPWAQRFAEHLIGEVRLALRRHPRLRARALRVYRWALAHIPPDPTYSTHRATGTSALPAADVPAAGRQR